MFFFHSLKIWNFRFKFRQQKKSILNGQKKKNLEKIFESVNKKNIKNSIFFIENLLLQNNYSNLISNNTISNFYRKHFIDSLTLIVFFNFFLKKKKKNFCLEIGTGGGFPGFLLSLFFYSCLYSS
jgi:16S rRNA G527 N7-methylase RsmG